MKIAPPPIIQEADVLPAVRDLLGEYPLLAYRNAKTVTWALRALHGVKADVFAVETAMEALEIEGEVLP
jgi:hypothetical protein